MPAARRGTENFKALFPAKFELLAKNQQGSPLGPPSGRGLMYTEANRKQKVSKQRKWNSLQDGYVGFSKNLDFDDARLSCSFRHDDLM